MSLNNFRLDKIDAKILAELDKNSKIPFSSLAKKLKISREIVKYRIKKLVNQGIIRSFTTMINPAKLGYMIYKVYLKFQNLPNELKLIEYLLMHKNVFWIAKCDGAFDMIFGIYVDNLVAFDNLLLDFMGHFSQNILSRHISNSVYVDIYRRNYLGNQESKATYWGGNPLKGKLDPIMKDILKTIAENSRTTIVELSNKLSSDPRTIISKIKEMEKRKIILGYRILIDLKKIRKESFKAIVYFKTSLRVRKDRLSSIANKILISAIISEILRNGT
ncbi:MAG: Lrp/AsnC family transcriptional regulator [Nanoarchaeota archaeon]|nr:Lrp/AsnC family transcriptional regulator [Nanoarchaeota archaeon]